MKDLYVVGKKRPEIVVKWPFMSHNLSGFFFADLPKLEAKKNVFCVGAFDLIKIFRVEHFKMTVRTSVL